MATEGQPNHIPQSQSEGSVGQGLQQASQRTTRDEAISRLQSNPEFNKLHQENNIDRLLIGAELKSPAWDAINDFILLQFSIAAYNIIPMKDVIEQRANRDLRAAKKDPNGYWEAYQKVSDFGIQYFNAMQEADPELENPRLQLAQDLRDLQTRDLHRRVTYPQIYRR
jgi:hypothetical protein